MTGTQGLDNVKGSFAYKIVDHIYCFFVYVKFCPVNWTFCLDLKKINFLNFRV